MVWQDSRKYNLWHRYKKQNCNENLKHCKIYAGSNLPKMKSVPNFAKKK